MSRILKFMFALVLIFDHSIVLGQVSDNHENAKLSQATSHPASTVSFVIVENETILFEEAEFNEVPENRTLIQPILGLKIFNDKWTMATRPSFEFLSLPHEEHDEDGISVQRISGFGDIGLTSLFTPIDAHEGLIWSFGYTATFPTASSEELGSGKFQLGPSASLFYLGNEYKTGLKSFNIGAFVEHSWSYAGDAERRETSVSTLQYVLMYRLSSTMQIGMEPKATMEWKEESGNRLIFPVGLGFGDIFNLGKIPIQWRVEGQYFLASTEKENEEYALVFTLEPILSSLFK